jgi:phosphoribosyl-dephospho-CoA transferase
MEFMKTPRPHDLLQLSFPDAPSDAPKWVHHTLSAVPWVVVRRAVAPAGLIAAGVRGSGRANRYAMTVAAENVAEVVGPEDLAHHTPAPARTLAVMRTLSAVRPVLDQTGLRWGPTGSVGFELATGVPTATGESDLDLLIRASQVTPSILRPLTELHLLFAGQPARIDCQVETPWGAAAFAELTGGQPEILMRTETGPQLVSRATTVS